MWYVWLWVEVYSVLFSGTSWTDTVCNWWVHWPQYFWRTASNVITWPLACDCWSWRATDAATSWNSGTLPHPYAFALLIWVIFGLTAALLADVNSLVKDRYFDWCIVSHWPIVELLSVCVIFSVCFYCRLEVIIVVQIRMRQ